MQPRVLLPGARWTRALKGGTICAALPLPRLCLAALKLPGLSQGTGSNDTLALLGRLESFLWRQPANEASRAGVVQPRSLTADGRIEGTVSSLLSPAVLDPH